ncbi:hypothetical protein [Macrococcus animalis]|uniref:hypothetical protein n=1 Tax=Macrococcus animalis TaxID=3395467 RepID=UPI0039BEC1E6
MEITNQMYIEYFEAYINGNLEKLEYDKETQKLILVSGLEKGIFDGENNETDKSFEDNDFTVNKLRIGLNGREIFAK